MIVALKLKRNPDHTEETMDDRFCDMSEVGTSPSQMSASSNSGSWSTELKGSVAEVGSCAVYEVRTLSFSEGVDTCLLNS